MMGSLRLAAAGLRRSAFGGSALRSLRVALRDCSRVLADAEQPGAAAFPKTVFELDRTQAPLSGRSAAAYFELARALWALRWKSARHAADESAWLRRLHEDVMLAHQLEREAMDRLAERP